MNNKKIVLLSLVTLTTTIILGVLITYYSGKSSEPIVATQHTNSNDIDQLKLVSDDQNLALYSIKASAEKLNDDSILTALKLIFSSNSLSYQQNLLKQLLQNLSESDVPKLAAYFARSNSSKPSYHALNIQIVEYWARFSVASALSFSEEQLPNKTAIASIQAILLNECAVIGAVRDCVSPLPKSVEMDTAIQKISTTLVQDNKFSQATIWLSTIDDYEKNYSELKKINDLWVAHDSEAAFEWASENLDFFKIADQALLQILETDPWQAYRYISLITDEHKEKRDVLYENLVDKLVKNKDFAGVSAVLESAKLHQAPLAMVAEEWADLDPVAAFKWTLEHNDYSNLANESISIVNEKDHWQAFELVSNVFNSPEGFREQLFNEILSNRKANQDYKSLFSMLEKIPQSDNAADLQEKYIGQFLADEPESAIQFIDGISASEMRSIWVIKAAESLGKESPLKAIELANNQRSEELRGQTTAMAIKTWAKQDIASASEWLKAQSSSEILDLSIAVASTEILNREHDKDLLLELAQTIGNDNLRNRVVDKISMHQ